ncbi:hypothetical protein ACJJIK_06155 [Microbulbifer sp. ZKSA006]|uniref:hypothetical protein n=1 Tax=Microbulbifer sp. ZKSA006 TaxID=3243390 RepID=UPI00403A60DF
MNEDKEMDLPKIKDKFDTGSAEHIVIIGYPENADFLPELISWSCFPNDPVCWVTYPYISSLRNEILAPAMADFLDFHATAEQYDMIFTAFDHFINERGESFRELIKEYLQNDEAKKLFSDPKYSIGQLK